MQNCMNMCNNSQAGLLQCKVSCGGIHSNLNHWDATADLFNLWYLAKILKYQASICGYQFQYHSGNFASPLFLSTKQNLINTLPSYSSM